MRKDMQTSPRKKKCPAPQEAAKIVLNWTELAQLNTFTDEVMMQHQRIAELVGKQDFSEGIVVGNAVQKIRNELGAIRSLLRGHELRAKNAKE